MNMTLPDQKTAKDSGFDKHVDNGGDTGGDTGGGDRIIWTIWLIIAVISIGLLPLTTRGMEIARAVASFCGYAL
jgi:hypothetical protein